MVCLMLVGFLLFPVVVNKRMNIGVLAHFLLVHFQNVPQLNLILKLCPITLVYDFYHVSLFIEAGQEERYQTEA